MIWNITGAICLLLFGLIPGLSFCFRERRKMERQYQNLLFKLDRAIGGELQEITYDESMDAAILERLNRVVQLFGMNREKAETERDMVKSMVSNITHQIRTPLTNIMLYSELLEEQQLSQDALCLANKIKVHSDKLDFFIKELVKSSYAEPDIISIYPEITDVEEIINTACQLIEVAAMKKKIEVVQKTENIPCFADKKWTAEAIGNILENAIKYSPEKSQIYVTVIPYENFVCVQIKDQGIGISEAEQGLIFKKFYRSEAAKYEQGFGIGLFLVREVLTKQGGFVKIESELGNGTTVQIYLSLHES